MYFVRFLDNGVSRKIAFEIYWPLDGKVQEQIYWKTADSTLHQDMGKVGQAVSHKPN